MKAAQLIKHTKTKASDALNLMGQLFKYMFDPALSRTYFPELERKSKIAILSENLFWFARYGDVNRFYYVLGLDCKNAVGKSEVMSYRKFMRIRSRRNLNPNGADFNYVCILRDKFVFSQFLTSLNFPTPKNEAILTSEQITWLRDARSAPLETLAECKEMFIDGFCKEVSGTRASGAFRLRIDRGKLFINENEASLGELKEQLFGRHLLQERVIQHPRMSELHPHSVNTLRLVTYNNKGTVKLFFVALKIGTKGSSVDNWGAGNIAIRINLETGRLWKEGVFYPGYGGRAERHPDTGVLFRDFEIPYFHAAVEMACKLHSYLYGVHSVGWDIAITPDGPMFIEGNDDWGGGLPLSLKDNFKSSFLQMYSMKS